MKINLKLYRSEVVPVYITDSEPWPASTKTNEENKAEVDEFYKILKAKRPTRNREIETRGFVYFMLCQHTGYLKIGKAKDPFPRMSDQIKIAPSNIKPVLILFCNNYSQAETSLHRMFKKYLVAGKKEWFKLNPIDAITGIICNSYFMVNHYLCIGPDIFPEEDTKELNHLMVNQKAKLLALSN